MIHGAQLGVRVLCPYGHSSSVLPRELQDLMKWLQFLRQKSALGLLPACPCHLLGLLLSSEARGAPSATSLLFPCCSRASRLCCGALGVDRAPPPSEASCTCTGGWGRVGGRGWEVQPCEQGQPPPPPVPVKLAFPLAPAPGAAGCLTSPGDPREAGLPQDPYRPPQPPTKDHSQTAPDWREEASTVSHRPVPLRPANQTSARLLFVYLRIS